MYVFQRFMEVKTMQKLQVSEVLVAEILCKQYVSQI